MTVKQALYLQPPQNAGLITSLTCLQLEKERGAGPPWAAGAGSTLLGQKLRDLIGRSPNCGGERVKVLPTCLANPRLRRGE